MISCKHPSWACTQNNATVSILMIATTGMATTHIITLIVLNNILRFQLGEYANKTTTITCEAHTWNIKYNLVSKSSCNGKRLTIVTSTFKTTKAHEIRTFKMVFMVSTDALSLSHPA